MRIPMKFMVDYAREKNFCISRFLVTNLESVEAVNRAALSADSPLLFDFYLPLMEDSCLYCVEDLAKRFVNYSHVPMGLFADHVDSVEKCLKAIDRGYSGVMIDLSARSLEENIEGTREVVSYAHRKGVFVEGEVGIISRSEEEEIVETDPRHAEDYIKRTGVDALGVSIGVHSGFYEKEPEINYGLIRQLRGLGVHLTLHGASGLSREVIGKCIEAGMNSTGFGTDQYLKFFSKMD
ncbi:MAG: class II fructose-bisphosphate aldolase [Actinomycetota bacterium]